MAKPKPTRANVYAPLAIDGNFYKIADVLDEPERAFATRVRAFMEREVQPIVVEHWAKGTFPFDIIPGMAALGVAGVGYRGFDCAGGSDLLSGIVSMEMARVDPSIATFHGVHSGLAMGSIYVCGSDEQKRRWLPAMAAYEKIGSFGLTEPDVGSGAGGGLTTTCRRGDHRVINEEKKWMESRAVYVRRGKSGFSVRSSWMTCSVASLATSRLKLKTVSDKILYERLHPTV